MAIHTSSRRCYSSSNRHHSRYNDTSHSNRILLFHLLHKLQNIYMYVNDLYHMYEVLRVIGKVIVERPFIASRYLVLAPDINTLRSLKLQIFSRFIV